MQKWLLFFLLVVFISIFIMAIIIAIKAYSKNSKNGVYKKQSNTSAFWDKADKNSTRYKEVEKRTFKRELIKTQIIGNDSKKSASSSIVRGAVGGALFGGIGAIGGAMSGKNKNSTTFLLIYNDGTRETMTVKNDSILYNRFIQLLEV